MDDASQAKLAVLESRLDRIDRTLESIATSLATLARIQVQHEEHDKRLTAIEGHIEKIKEEMPLIKLVSTTLRAGTVALLGGIGLLVLKAAGIVF